MLVIIMLVANNYFQFSRKINLLFRALGGNSNGDKHRPNFGEMHAVLAHAVLDASDAKQLGLSSFVSLDAGDEERASKLMARNGLDAREK